MRGFHGVRVLDLSTGLAGAYCTKLLADAGADVVKLEPPDGDPLRRYSASASVGADGDEDGALFRYLCTSKASIVGDLRDMETRDLAAGANLVVETFTPGVVEASGLGFDDLARRNPAVTLVSISPFGRGGPRSGEEASEFLLQGWSGSIHAHGLPGRIPLAVGGRLGEWSAGAYAALGAATALVDAARTGRGAHVDVSILECLALTLVAYPTLSASFPGGSSKRMVGVMFPSVEPCKDGFVGLFVLTAQQWEMLFAMVERPDLAGDPDLATIAGRMARGDEVREAIRGWTREHTAADVVERAALYRVPAAPIGNGCTLPELEHLVARRVFVPNPRRGFVQPRPPFRSDPAAAALRAAPRLHENERPPWRTSKPAARAQAEEEDAPPLAGVRVLDLTAFWAGPYATLYLASVGADVLKVESVQRPDPMRFNVTVDPSVPQWYEQGFLYHAANLGKRSITLNLSDSIGRDLLLRLAARCDVVIENFTPRVMEQFGLGYEQFVAVRPDIIVVRMPAFGLDGPSRDRPGFATTMEQAAGMAWMTGYKDDAPTVPGGMCDPLTGVHAAYAVLVALEHRSRTGEGQHIEIPMIEVAANVTAEQVVEWSAYGALLGRQGNRGPLAAPQGVYACDGEEEWLAIAVADDAQWEALRSALGDVEWAADPELDTADGRRRRHDLIDSELASWCAAAPRDDLLAVLAGTGVPAAPVVAAARIDEDEQMRARGFWEQVRHPIVGTHTFPGWPFRLSPSSASWYRGPAPLLGEHTEDVLRQHLALDDEQLARLRERQVIGNRLASE